MFGCSLTCPSPTQKRTLFTEVNRVLHLALRPTRCSEYGLRQGASLTHRVFKEHRGRTWVPWDLKFSPQILFQSVPQINNAFRRERVCVHMALITTIRPSFVELRCFNKINVVHVERVFRIGHGVRPDIISISKWYRIVVVRGSRIDRDDGYVKVIWLHMLQPLLCLADCFHTFTRVAD